MARILIKNGRVWDGARFLHADILTEGRSVSKIERHIFEHADFTYDARGKLVSAGLVDAHMHMRGISSEEFGMQAEMSCFPFGVTAAADAGAGRGDKALLDSFLLKNAVFIEVPTEGNHAKLAEAQGRLSLYGDKAVGLKVYLDTTVSDVRDVTPLKEACELARERGLRVMVHSSHSPVPMAELLGALDRGDILTHAFHGGENNASLDGFCGMREAQSRGVFIDVGFAGHVHTDFGVLRAAIRAGVLPDLISTDITRYSAFTRGGRYGMTMCMSIARSLGMREEDILPAVTSRPAEALGKEAEWGCLAEGARADIAVLDYTDAGFDLTDQAGNRVFDTVGYRCVLTVLDGQIVYIN